MDDTRDILPSVKLWFLVTARIFTTYTCVVCVGVGGSAIREDSSFELLGLDVYCRFFIIININIITLFLR